ncbi:glycosyltransferase family 4 protein [Patescibacteria group bacterium]|nr:glycosyltransferase family 4 protein [Patescibacteria group bacterium]MCL5092010.1 glycosyltransferase family 4 protein [Patescibacteria group bacterium]
MRIGINGYYLTTLNSGIGQYSINLLRALAEIDKKNKYFVFTTQKIDWNLPENFRLKVVSPLPLFRRTFFNRFFWEEYQLGNALKRYKIEVFHGLYQSLPRSAEKIGAVVTIHDAIPWRFPFERKQLTYRWYSDLRKDLVTKRANKIITVSETSKIDFAAIYGIKPETIEVTYESIDPVFWKKPTPTEIDQFKKTYKLNRDYILYTGGLKRHKNIRMLIKSFAILIKDHGYQGDLYILGAIRKTMAVSPYIYYRVEDLEKYAKLKKIGDRVKFVGFVSRKDMSLFMHQAQAFVSLSLYEGFGLPAIEAMTSGTPSVLSNLGAYPEIAAGAGLFVYPYGPHRIAEALHRVVTDANLSRQLVKKGLEKARFFDRIKIAQRVLEIYKEVYDDYKINFQP